MDRERSQPQHNVSIERNIASQDSAMQARQAAASSELPIKLARYQLIYSIAGLALGLACIVGGIVLFFHGVLGSTTWIGTLLGANSKLVGWPG